MCRVVEAGVGDKVSQTTPSIPIYVKARKKGKVNEGTVASAKGKMQAPYITCFRMEEQRIFRVKADRLLRGSTEDVLKIGDRSVVCRVVEAGIRAGTMSLNLPLPVSPRMDKMYSNHSYCLYQS